MCTAERARDRRVTVRTRRPGKAISMPPPEDLRQCLAGIRVSVVSAIGGTGPAAIVSAGFCKRNSAAGLATHASEAQRLARDRKAAGRRGRSRAGRNFPPEWISSASGGFHHLLLVPAQLAV